MPRPCAAIRLYRCQEASLGACAYVASVVVITSMRVRPVAFQSR
jgi:hypothetical protein